MTRFATRLTLGLALTAAPVAFLAARGQAPDSSKRSIFMRQKLEFSKRVLEGLSREDFELIVKNGRALKVLSQAAEWEVPTIPNVDQYLPYTAEFQKATDEMVAAARDKNLDGATLAYVRLTMNCVNCHKYVRKVAR